MNEVWKDIEGYEGLYQVSNLGCVKSLTRKVRCKNNKFRIIIGKILIPIQTKNGYLFVNLWKNNKIKRVLVHRLVAETFIPNPENKPEVNHINGNKLNNYVDNLEWNTRSENTIHSYKIKLRENQKKSISQNNKKMKSKIVYQYDLNGNLIKIFPSASEAARHYGYNQSAISECCRGLRKRIYGSIWKYMQTI